MGIEFLLMTDRFAFLYLRRRRSKSSGPAATQAMLSCAMLYFVKNRIIHTTSSILRGNCVTDHYSLTVTKSFFIFSQVNREVTCSVYETCLLSIASSVTNHKK